MPTHTAPCWVVPTGISGIWVLASAYNTLGLLKKKKKDPLLPQETCLASVDHVVEGLQAWHFVLRSC